MSDAHELKISTCMTCKFFSRVPQSKNLGICKERPPQVTVVMMVQHNPLSNQSQQRPMPISAFPQVGEDEWCGQHAMKWHMAS